MTNFAEIDMDLNLDLDLEEEWNSNYPITLPMGMEPLSEDEDYSQYQLNSRTCCYFCDNLAVIRLRSGHPVCKYCENEATEFESNQ